MFPATVELPNGLGESPVNGPYGWVGGLPGNVSDQEAVALLGAAVHDLQSRGATRILGPMAGTTFDAYRLNLGPYDLPPFPLEPWNEPHHPALWRRAGFRLAEHYSSIQVPDTAPLIAPEARRTPALEAKGFRFRRLESPLTEMALAHIHALTLEAYQDARWFTPIRWTEFQERMALLQDWLPDHALWVVEEPEGRWVGYLLGYLYGLARQDLWCVKTLAVEPHWQRRGLCTALVEHAYEWARDRHGITRGVVCLIHEGNASERLDRGQGQVLRRYGLFEWKGGGS